MLEIIQSDPFLRLQHELKQFGLLLEHYSEWLGEGKVPHKYIVLRGSSHVAYAKTLAGVKKALSKEKKAHKPTTTVTELKELSQLTLFD